MSLISNNQILFSLETLKIFIKAFKFSNYTKIKPCHILNSILYTSNLVSLILNKKNLQFNSLNINKKIIFSTTSLKLLTYIIRLKKNNINSIDLLQYYLNYNKYFTIFILKNFNFKRIRNLKFLYVKFPNNFIKHLFYIKNFKNIIIGRLLEINKVLKIISSRVNKNLILIGIKGIGKLSIIKGVFQTLKTFKFNEPTVKKEMFLIKLNLLKKDFNLIFYESYLITWLLKYKNIIFIIPEVEHLFINYKDNVEILLSIIKSFILKLTLQLIITSTVNLKNLHPRINTFEFNCIEILEPIYIEIVKILQLKNLELYRYYKYKLKFNSIKKIIKLSELFLKNEIFPIKSINILNLIYSIFILNKNIYKLYNIETTLIEQAIAIQTNIPIDLITKNIYNKFNLNNLNFLIKQNIFGQDIIIQTITNTLKRVLIGVKSSNKPLGSWLLCGPSGTGKTELAKTLSKILFGSDNKLIRFDMSEFMEKHSISKLIGSPPGYIGFGNKGLLTEAIEKQPYSVLLFDEIEKADPTICNLMLQILDDGHLRDSSGNIIKFSTTIILYTSNLGCPIEINEFNSIITKTNFYNYTVNKKNIYKAIKTYFRPEFINRLDNIFIFEPLNENTLILIINKYLSQFNTQFKELKIPIIIKLNKKVKLILSKLSNSPLYGARPLKRILDNLISNPIIELILKLKIYTPHIIIYTFNFNKNFLKYSILPVIVYIL